MIHLRQPNGFREVPLLLISDLDHLAALGARGSIESCGNKMRL